TVKSLVLADPPVTSSYDEKADEKAQNEYKSKVHKIESDAEPFIAGLIANTSLTLLKIGGIDVPIDDFRNNDKRKVGVHAVRNSPLIFAIVAAYIERR